MNWKKTRPEIGRPIKRVSKCPQMRGDRGVGSYGGCRDWRKWKDHKETERDKGNRILSTC